MKSIKKLCNYVFIDGLSGMATGLFATLIIGTIIDQIGKYIPGRTGALIIACAAVMKSLTGAGIGVGLAAKFKDCPYVAIAAAGAGMIGAHAKEILAGTAVAGPGEPLGAFIAAIVAVTLGRLVAGKTGVDILVTPAVTVFSGGIAGLAVGPTISDLMTKLGDLIEWGTERQPLLMGIIVSVVMGIVLTLPISSAALGLSLGLGGIAAGAATIGCCAQMVGFAVASFRENKWSGLVSQGLGTSMLQIPNIMRRPLIWLPPILTSAILGPVGTVIFKMEGNAIGCGMGTSGLVGQFTTFDVMTSLGHSGGYTMFLIILMHFVLPAVLTLSFSELMRRKRWIRRGDMKLEI